MIAFLHTAISSIRHCFICCFPSSYHVHFFTSQVAPVKASFVEYIVQECPEGVTERGTCQRLTPESDTEVRGTEREDKTQNTSHIISGGWWKIFLV